jgi:hypothetical protein
MLRRKPISAGVQRDSLALGAPRAVRERRAQTPRIVGLCHAPCHASTHLPTPTSADDGLDGSARIGL